MKPLIGKVCLVTGASRGIGKGIALQLGEAGATVYVTARTLESEDGMNGMGSLTETVTEINCRGGKGIPVQLDHSNENEVASLFDKIRKEQQGQLDLLVNNAFSAAKVVLLNMFMPFWEQPASMWDEVNNVGLRNYYMCSAYAASMMVSKKQGLIINISCSSGLSYNYSVACGIGKEACDRMSSACAYELRAYDVAYVSLWPGYVRTETFLQTIQRKTCLSDSQEMKKVESNIMDGETPEYVGKCVVHLLCDNAVLRKSGQVLLTADLGDEYGFFDIDGRRPWSIRSMRYLAHNYFGLPKWIADWIPHFCKIPQWMVFATDKKF